MNWIINEFLKRIHLYLKVLILNNLAKWFVAVN